MKLPMQKANQTYDWESPSCAISCGKFQKMRLQDVSILSKVKVLFVMIVALFVLAKLFKLTVVAQKLRLSPATHSTNVTNLHRAAQFTNIASHAVFSQIIRIHWPNLFWVQLYPWSVYSAQLKINFNSASPSAVLLRYQESISKYFKTCKTFNIRHFFSNFEIEISSTWKYLSWSEVQILLWIWSTAPTIRLTLLSAL